MQLKQIVWQIAIRNKSEGFILKDKEAAFKAVPNPIGMWAADPFVMEKNGKIYIFAELFSLSQWKGKIGYCVFEKGKFSPWKIIFDEAPHYSYPYIFEFNDETYMMPETGSLREIAIYKAVEFPLKWEKVSTILSGEKMVDSIFLSNDTILSYKMVGNYKNLLTYLKKQDDKWMIYHSEVDNEEIKRPAGKAFYFGEDLIRPAQDGRKIYGGSLKFFKCNIGEMEEEIGSLLPEEIKVKKFNKTIVGTHTYNATDNYEIIDFQYYKFSLVGLIKRILLKLSNFRR